VPHDSSSKEPIEISIKSVLKMVLLAAAVFLLIKLASLILLFFLGSMLTVVLEPICKRIEKFGLARKYAVGIIALTLFGFLFTFGALIIPAVTHQIAGLMPQFSKFRTDLLAQIPDAISPKLPDGAKLMEHGVSIVGGAAEILVSFSLIWIFSVYLLADGKRSFRWFCDFFGAPTRMKLNATAHETSNVVSAYATGQFITSIACAIYCYLVLTALQVPGALTLALLAGAFDVVPIVGFFVAVIPAAILAYSMNPMTGLIVLVAYTIYHLAENYLIIPAVYGSRMKVSGLVVILALLVGASVGGVLLAIAILPIVASYPIIEKIWLVKYLGRDVIDRHARLVDQSTPSEQVKMWDVKSLDFKRATTLTNRDLSKHFKRKILIVEDDPDIREMLRDVLETEGYRVHIASNGQEALNTFETIYDIGLVLMDINMPVMDGKKLFETMKTMPILSTIPVVFLSASDDTLLDIDGAAGILKKPSRLEDIINMVERLYRQPKILTVS
jgi:predicted PurR-regulated permease PerM/ActR/RegA family two-component response regulator